jgi:23S rRNA (cytidine1920-2'-O)/16S rRNA (cytidine1409-2'-O)-methyltransferase
MVRRGLAPSRERAQADIAAGRVLVAGSVADKPARLVAAGEPIRLVGPPPRFVGRGGEKLEGALERFDVAVAGGRWLDAGASTGGFTDCLLQRGASAVVAVDVGHRQQPERIRADERVDVRERTNVRFLTSDEVGGQVDGVAADLSFISLTTVLPALVGVSREGADLVVLVKPQFEAGRAEAGRGRGVIRDPAVWRRVLTEVSSAAASAGAAMMSAMVSPLTGADGNVEFFLHCQVGGPGARDRDAVDTAAHSAIDAAVTEATTTHGAG